MKWQCGLAGGMAVVFFGSVLWAAPGVVKLTNGQTIQGEIKDGGDTVTVTTHGIDTTIDRSRIAGIAYVADNATEFSQRHAKLDAKDVAGRIALARWAFDKQLYNEARRVLDEAQQLDPNNAQVATFIDTINRQVRLERQTAQAANPTAGDDNQTGRAEAPAPSSPQRQFLSPADINLIRQKELKDSDNVRVRFENDVQRRYCDIASVNLADFKRLPMGQQARQILDRQDKALSADVKIETDPSVLSDFKRRIQPLTLSGCAAANCHGGKSGGDFILFGHPGGNDAITYTNFYILQRYATKVKETDQGGIFGGPAKRKMIDRVHSTQSLLLQYALPSDKAQYRHPEVFGYKGFIPNTQNMRYRQILAWINTLKTPEPDYKDIEYQPPVAATQPATTESAAQ